MEGARERRRAAALGPPAVRFLLAVPLALGVAGNLMALPAWLREPGQDARYYIVNAAICLVPATLYALAALLVVAAWARPVVWIVLLACGLALSAVGLFSVITFGLGELFLVPPYLVAVSVLQLVALMKARKAAAGGARLVGGHGQL
jgi:hypothetical protein